ncbi:MAG: PQQ-binding-like beta-propeller repeat protein [Planctomycetes bacterium]|nr:PQQ-binding-like beta-propeller repeat protein [Planctomycetota bacterium]
MMTATLCLALTLASSAADGGDWPRWRGPRDDGSAAPGSYPVKWDAGKVLWKAELPGKGCSTPIVWNQRIYVTSASTAPAGGLDAVLAFDDSGKRLWQTTLGPEIPGKHRNGSGSNPSPATDGSAIFVAFKSGTLAALEFDGAVRWRIDLVERFGPDNRYWDGGTSPALTPQCVIMARMHEGESWLAAFDKATGRMRWKVPRTYETPREGDQAYTTPIVFSHRGKDALLVWGAHHLTAHDAEDGGLLWSCGGFNPQSTPFWPAVASPVIAGEIAVVPCGRADRGQPRLHGIKLGGSGDVTATHRIWKRDDTGSFVPTPAAHEGRAYVVRDQGDFDCIDAATGKTLWSGRLSRGKGSFYASPLIAGGHAYVAREDGVIFVVRVKRMKDAFEVVAEIAMGERVIASPIAVAGRILIRGERHLFCVADR